MPEAQARGHAAKRLGQHDAGQMLDIGKRGGGAGLLQRNRDVLPLGDVPLEDEQIIDAIAHRARDDGNAGGEREAERGEDRLPGPALEIAQRHAEGRADEAVQADAFEDRWLELRRRLRAHRLRGRQPHGLAHRSEHADEGGAGARREARRRWPMVSGRKGRSGNRKNWW